MPAKIRLQRHGRKRKAFYHIVVADSRSKRDGRFIEKLGVYNPNTNPASIDLDFDRAVYWVSTGAQSSDTARAILSYEGVLHRNHLNKGVLKGAFTQEEADAKFEKWLSEKGDIIQNKVDKLSKEKAAEQAARLAAETEVKEARAKEVMAKNSELAGEVAEEGASEEATAEAATEEPAVEAATEEPATEEPAAEAAAEAATEEPAAEAATEEPAAEAATEEPAAEAATEEPAAEAATEEPAAEAATEEPAAEAATEEPAAEAATEEPATEEGDDASEEKKED